MDTLAGTAGNDTFTADNTGTAQLSVSDSISGGAGTDPVKVFLATTGSTLALPTLTDVETLQVVGGQLASLNVASVAA